MGAAGGRWSMSATQFARGGLVWLGCLSAHLVTMIALDRFMRRSSYNGVDVSTWLFDLVWLGSSIAWSILATWYFRPAWRSQWPRAAILLVATLAVFLIVGFMATVSY